MQYWITQKSPEKFIYFLISTDGLGTLTIPAEQQLLAERQLSRGERPKRTFFIPQSYLKRVDADLGGGFMTVTFNKDSTEEVRVDPPDRTEEIMNALASHPRAIGHRQYQPSVLQTIKKQLIALLLLGGTLTAAYFTALELENGAGITMWVPVLLLAGLGSELLLLIAVGVLLVLTVAVWWRLRNRSEVAEVMFREG